MASSWDRDGRETAPSDENKMPTGGGPLNGHVLTPIDSGNPSRGAIELIA